MAASATSFSYAQAAKGEVSQSSPTPLSKSSSTPEATEPVPSDTPHPEADSDEHPSLPNGIATAEQNAKKTASVALDTATIHQTGTKAQQMPTGEPPASEIGAVEQGSKSRQSASQSTPPHATINGATRDDAANTAAQNDLDSNWEKISQASHSDAKATSKTGSDIDEATPVSEQATTASNLKDAPLPAFNIWHKRAADAKSKAHEAKPVNPGALAVGGEVAAGMKKPNDAHLVSSIKKKGVSRQNTDDRPSPTTKELLSGSGSTQSMAPKAPGVPPPPTDAMSWPTPENAKEDEKKKAAEKVEKSEKSEADKTPNKPHGKEKWVQMPYVPTAVFSTPLPTNRRGGRAARGGREASGRGNASGAVPSDKIQGNGGPIIGAGNPTSGPPRGDMGPPRPGPLHSKAKRASSAGPSTSAETRQTGDEASLKSASNPRPAPGDGRRVTSGQQAGSRQWSPTRRGNALDTEFGIRSQNPQQDAMTARAVVNKGNDTSRLVGDANGYTGPRERGEGRTDRGRGGYRGRGNFNNTGGQHPTGNQGYMPPAGSFPTYGTAKSQSYSSDPRRESLPVGSTFPNPREPRHSRTNSRSQSIPSTSFGRYPTAQHLPPLHTESANVYYPHGHPAVMSAVPYPGYMEQLQLSGLVQMQMEYYFSVDNLCKDMFLRKHMDSQGFVFLDVLVNFNRIKQLTQDAELIRLVCLRSPSIELLTGGDGVDRLRRRGDWQQWVMSKEDRDPSARNDGPAQLHLPQASYAIPFGDPKMMAGVNGPKTAHPGAHFRPEPLVLGDGYAAPGMTTETPSAATPVETPLSAAVPDFTPAMHIAPSSTDGSGPVPAYSKVSDPSAPKQTPEQEGQDVPNGAVPSQNASATTSSLPNGVAHRDSSAGN